MRSILAAIVLLPMLASGWLAGSRLAAASASRRHAEAVADDAAALQRVTSARVQLNGFAVPLETAAYASSLGMSLATVDRLVHPEVPFAEQLDDTTAAIPSFPVFGSDALRGDVARLRDAAVRVSDGSISPGEVGEIVTTAQAHVDEIWHATFNELQGHIAEWREPGAYSAEAALLPQIYQAFVSGGQAMRHASDVLQGTVDTSARSALVRANGEFVAASGQFASRLSGRAGAAWQAMQADPARDEFAAVIDQAVEVALGEPSPYGADPVAAGAASARGLVYVNALDDLVVAASQDLRDDALGRAGAATAEFWRAAALAVVLVVVVLAGVIVAGQVLIRPLRRLAAVAHQVHRGEFDLPRLAETGPRETAAASAAFNEMAATLKAVEVRALALASEDFSNPELDTVIAGRTGRALQASIDSLAEQIRERERQRVLLHEDATHDKATGLLNRGAVLDYLTNDVARRREAGEAVAVLFLDLDGLKQINDRHGHDVGDVAIKLTAAAILESTHICDVVGRLGGDEFLIVLCDEHSADGELVAASVNARLSQRPLEGDDLAGCPLRASVGIAIARCDAETDPLELVRQADAAMYVAKRNARAALDELQARRAAGRRGS